MKPRRRRDRKLQKRQVGHRDNESRIAAIKKKTQQELDKFAGIVEENTLRKQQAEEQQRAEERNAALQRQAEEQKQLLESQKRAAARKKAALQKKNLQEAEKNIDRYKKMSYTELRKVAKEFGISIYRRKKEDVLSEVLKKVTQENNDAEDTHQPLGTEDVV
jgi:hypothetical protein